MNISPSWHFIQHSCKNIAHYFKHLNIETVIGISNGGVIPATLVARDLNCRVKVIDCQSYNADNARIKSTVNLYNIFDSLDALTNVLIVDDICDTGETFLDIFKAIPNNNQTVFSIHTSAIFYRDTSKYEPSFYANHIDGTDWVHFPWED
jgi:xanthine phosphoribosyltransferase